MSGRKNLSRTTIAVGTEPPASGLALTLQAGTGPWMPETPARMSTFAPGVIPSLENAEIVQMASVVGDVVTLSGRGQCGTVAQAIEPGWQFTNAITVEDFEELEALIMAETTRAEAAEAQAVKLTGAQTVAGVKTFGSSPVIPTPAAKDSSTKAASTVFVEVAVGEEQAAREGAVTAAIATAEGASDAAGVAAAAVATERGQREAADAALTASDALKAAKAANLSDIASAGEARQNLHVPELLPVQAVATANIAALTGLQTIDGFTLEAEQVVLLTAQAEAKNNGPWVVAAGAWTRPTDFPAGAVVKAREVAVINGTVNAHSEWLLKTNGTVTVGTTAQVWEVLLPSSVVSGSLVEHGEVAGEQTPNLSEARVHGYTAIGAIKIKKPSNWPVSAAVATYAEVVVKQDATGGRAITTEGIIWPTGEPEFNTAANAVNLIQLTSFDNGAHVYGSFLQKGAKGAAGVEGFWPGKLLLPSEVKFYESPASSTTSAVQALAESFPRNSVNEALVKLATKVPVIAAIPVQAGKTIHGIGFYVKTADTTRTHLWVALLNSKFELLKLSADYTSAVNTPLLTTKLNALKLASSYVTPAEELLYAVLVNVAATPIEILMAKSSAGLTKEPPRSSGKGEVAVNEPAELASPVVVAEYSETPYMVFV
jgi:hypothetical protein